MAKIEKFEDLDCWKSARELVNLVYDLCERKELARDWDTVRQIKRASISSMNNIAEGFARFNEKEFINFLNIAQASILEVRSMSYILIDRKYVSDDEFKSLQDACLKTGNLTIGLIRYLKNRKK